MADGEKIDAFLYFGHQIDGGKGPKKIDGETSDSIESEVTADYGKSMGISGYQFSGTAHPEGSAEQHRKDMERARTDPKFNPYEPVIQPITITKAIDAASPFLLAAMWFRVEYDVAWIVQKKAGGQAKRSGEYFWEIYLENVVVESLNWSAEAGGGVTETLTLSFMNIQATYHVQDRHGNIEKNGRSFDLLRRTKDNDKDGDAGGGGASDQQVKDMINKFAKQNSLKLLK